MKLRVEYFAQKYHRKIRFAQSYKRKLNDGKGTREYAQTTGNILITSITSSKEFQSS